MPVTFPDKSRNIINIYKGNSNSHWTLILPAMGIRASYYHNLANKMSVYYDSNFVTIDLRGYGNSSIRASRKENFGFVRWLEDLNFIIDFLLKESQKDKINLLGHSIGGQLGTMYYSLHPDKIQRLILVGSSLPYFRIWKWPGKLKLLIAGYIGPFVSRIIGYFPGEIIGFAGRESMGCISDWANIVRTGKFNLGDCSFDFENAMSKVVPNITAISFPEDNLAPPYTVKYLIQKFNNSAKIEEKIINGFDHFNWTKRADDFIARSELF